MRGCRVDGFELPQCPDPALGTARDGARHVTRSRHRTTARQDEIFERRQRLVERIELAFQARDLLRLDGHASRNAQLATQIEELVLDFGEAVEHDLGQFRCRQQHADRAVELIDSPVRFDPRRVLRDALSIAEAGGTVIAGARIDLAEAITHCYWSVSGPNSSSTAP